DCSRLIHRDTSVSNRRSRALRLSEQTLRGPKKTPPTFGGVFWEENGLSSNGAFALHFDLDPAVRCETRHERPEVGHRADNAWNRLRLAHAERLDLVARHTPADEIVAYGIGATLGQALVVLLRADAIGMAGDENELAPLPVSITRCDSTDCRPGLAIRCRCRFLRRCYPACRSPTTRSRSSADCNPPRRVHNPFDRLVARQGCRRRPPLLRRRQHRRRDVESLFHPFDFGFEQGFV